MDTILGVLNLINTWKNLEKSLSPVPKGFVKLLIKFTKLKFEYELGSNVYQVVNYRKYFRYSVR